MGKVSYSFEEPVRGDRLSAEEASNRRLIVVPIEYVPEVRTQRGDVVDAIRVNVVDLEGDNGPTPYYGVMWFGGRVIGAFRNKLGKPFIGYLTKEKTGGGFLAWTFYSLTQDEQTVALASNFLNSNPDFMHTCEADVLAASGSQGQARQEQAPQQPQQAPQQGLAPLGQQPPAPQPQQQPLAPLGQAPAAPQPQQQAQQPAAVPEPPLAGSGSLMERLRAQRDAAMDRTAEQHQQATTPF